MELKRRARKAAVICLALLIVDFLTLANRVVTTNPSAQAMGRVIGVAALIGLILSLMAIILGHRKARAEGLAEPVPFHVARRSRLRSAKIAVALLVLAAWLIGMPAYLYHSRLAGDPSYVPGPWIADAFLSLFAVGMQLIAPTPVALAFWPSLLASVYLLFSRKDRPMVDAICSLVALGLTGALGYVLLAGIEL